MKIKDNKKNIKDRERRGQISAKELNLYVEFSTRQLIEMLNHDYAQKRTIAATILGNKKDNKGIKPLCATLKNEKALYSRIAISEALGKMGEKAVLPLIELLGQIGKNQELKLPIKYFNKGSYPLARDMAARTLIKIGSSANPHLIQIVSEKDGFKTQQAIDALGGIAAKTDNKMALPVLIDSIKRYSNNKITLWKIVRALSGFKDSKEAINPLIEILKSKSEPAICWEAVRSLGQIGICTDEVKDVLNGLKDINHPEIRKAVNVALIRLENSEKIKGLRKNKKEG
jgi:HEAT repeat protein